MYASIRNDMFSGLTRKRVRISIRPKASWIVRGRTLYRVRSGWSWSLGSTFMRVVAAHAVASHNERAPAGVGAGFGGASGATEDVRGKVSFGEGPSSPHVRARGGRNLASSRTHQRVRRHTQVVESNVLPKRVPANSSAHAHAVQAARTARTRSAPHRYRDARRQTHASARRDVRTSELALGDASEERGLRPNE